MMLHLIPVLALIVISPMKIAASCKRRCGAIEVPYPFGLLEDAPDCYFNLSHAVDCDRNSTPEVPYLGNRRNNFSISNISVVDHELRIPMFISRDCYSASGHNINNIPSIGMRHLTISGTKNTFTAIGCDTYAVLSGAINYSNKKYYKTGCLTTCTDLSSVVDGQCSGIGCCQTGIPKNAYGFNITVLSYNNHSDVIHFNNCSYAFVAANDSFHFSKEYLKHFKENELPLVLDWSVGDGTCKEAKRNKTSYMCKGNSTCSDADNGTGYRCRCKKGYEGNPYLSGHEGCQDINECNNTINRCDVNAHCHNTLGNFTCSCRKGYYGDGWKCAKISSVKDTALGVSISISFLVLLCSGLYCGIRQRKIIKQRKEFFQQNGGLMLPKLLAKHNASMETTRIFTNEELKKATNNYHESTILGQGGHGTVYKGEINNKVVAIKKSKLVDQTQVKVFLNEVVLLTQINHKNVVKLIGCCLETEVPLLVYEFITNGTLFDHIHNCGDQVHMSWRSRLCIAAEIAGALSYLHTDASNQIIHRDIKTANILLDNNYVAKISDFGASKLVPNDQAQFATLVQGTLGYLDPECLSGTGLTDKSDVYSFGVVLAELLTGMKAFSFGRLESQRSLSVYFVCKYNEGNLLDIIDKNIFQDEFVEEIKEVAKLTTCCLQMRGEERPSMKDVSLELEGLIRVIESHLWVESNCDEMEEKSLNMV